MNIDDIRSQIERAYEDRASLTPATAAAALKEAVEGAIGLLDRGEARVAEQRDRQWTVNEWLKKAVLLYFRLHPNQVIEGGHTRYYDKLPLKYTRHDAATFAKEGARIVPDAIVRRGAFIGADVVLMPSYVNIGAYVGSGT
ncbi:MAG TPA: 2,3,4,5-tetrahydropyridine-2,6-dicarboxylate N-succinyltransferase, partial [Gammaproteobacteria bacterium]